MKICLGMWIFGASIIVVLVVLQLVQDVDGYTRSDFPSHFIFGAGTSASQVEGTSDEDGRTPSILDNYKDVNGNKTKWDRASDQYHKYKEDVKLMSDTGLEAYKFSISWSRLLPNGRGYVNPKAVAYYNNLINELISHGIEPHVLLLHQDMPQVLEDQYEGWLSPQIVNDFVAYADVCFKEFGDRVSHWTTINEPNVLIPSAYDMGTYPPNRCSFPFGSCSKGNSTTEPYIVAHNTLLSHASAVKLYRTKYQGRQQGYIGLNLYTGWFRPETNTIQDLRAMQRARDFLVGWFLDPITRGDYPDVMKKDIGSRLPTFSDYESNLVKNSFDFIGVNCYNSFIVKNTPRTALMDLQDYAADCGTSTKYVGDDDGAAIQHVLEHFKEAYGNPPIYIHENGYRLLHNSSLNDLSRVKYLNASIGGLLNAVRNGSNTRGYFVWSFMDVLEGLGGVDDHSFGLYKVDFDSIDLKRYPKLSAHWYSSFLKGLAIDDHHELLLQLTNSTFLNHGLSTY